MHAPAESTRKTFDADGIALPTGSFVNGQRRDGDGEALLVHRPSDGRLIASMPGARQALIDEAVAAAALAFRTSGWREASPRHRGAVMRRWADLVEAHGEELARLEAVTTTRVIAETRVRDVPVTAELLRFYGECADKFDGALYPTASSVWSIGVPEPYGVVGAISPWNVPMVLSTAKFAPAIAAGNAVVLKPSELTPFTAVRLAELAIEAGLPPGLFNVVVGTGPEAGEPLVRHPEVACVSFTGSTVTGRRIMAAAAEAGPKPVTLELGGKSPQIVFADVPDRERLADMVAAGTSRNGGQLCYCGSRLIVHESLANQLLEDVAARLKQAKAGATWDERTTLAPIVSSRQLDRVDDIVRRGAAAGAEIRLGGTRIETHGGAFYAPTIALAGQDNPLQQEEVFGPVLSVQTFREPEEAFSLAAHDTYGLAAGIHTQNITRALDAARRIEAGMVWINTYGRSTDIGTPFGGFKRSGFGKDFGAAAYLKYTRLKNVWIDMTI
ncbi:aldehyde dehydrogenase (NAD+) [Microvirga flocculans]|uniref:Aldehyde dehydrogenase (NAD+) n=1 Tax=Microvirga flocculans TaxID=217168 RepID=A0A7W6IGZ6_9HYPH|nr:aldehyde dehydrogenase family protein [Microvirga flocculans]MBB4041169.1 aldehyde dehydrogenase (NAD+) [Microvirga flocculans]